MIFDYCCSVGEFPFRRVPDSNPEGLLRLMDEVNVDMALVSSLEGFLYRNVQAANELLTERISLFRDRLAGAAIINPAYAQAKEDTIICLQEMGMKALRLYPGFHGYDLRDACVEQILKTAETFRIPVSIVMRAEDERQRHWLIQTTPPSTEAMAYIISLFPGISFVLERASAAETLALSAAIPDANNWSVEISGRAMWLRASNPGEKSIISEIGIKRIIFGTDMPLQYAAPAFYKVDEAGLEDADREAILHGNAMRLLHL